MLYQMMPTSGVPTFIHKNTLCILISHLKYRQRHDLHGQRMFQIHYPNMLAYSRYRLRSEMLVRVPSLILEREDLAVHSISFAIGHRVIRPLDKGPNLTASQFESDGECLFGFSALHDD
jgi:hypothetical protein